MPKEFQWCFEFQGSFLGMSKKFQKCFKEVFGKVQWCSKGVQVRLNGISSSFMGVSKVLERSV